MESLNIEALNIEISLNGLTIGDLELFDRMAKKEASNGELLGLLDRVVIGGAKHLPLKAMQAVVAKLGEAMATMSNPETGEGN